MNTQITIAALAALIAAPGISSAQQAAKDTPMKNIVQVAVDAGSFKTLVAAVKAAGLAETLQGDGPFTVFAPTDAAFAKLPAGTIEKLLADKEQLKAILLYHVVPAKIVAQDIVKSKGARPTTVNGQVLDITLRDGRVYVDNALLSSADIMASNGVIHVIDAVVLPRQVPATSGR